MEKKEQKNIDSAPRKISYEKTDCLIHAFLCHHSNHRAQHLYPSKINIRKSFNKTYYSGLKAQPQVKGSILKQFIYIYIYEAVR